MQQKVLNIITSIIYYITNYTGGILEEQVKLRKIGGSLVATIPKDIVKTMNLKEKDKISINIKKEKQDYFGIYSGKIKFEESDRLDTRIN